MNIPVITYGTSQDNLVSGLERLHGPVTVVRRCAELTELLAACQSGLARAAVVSDGTEGLTASLVARLDALGVSVVALTDEHGEAERLGAIGVVPAAAGIDPGDLAGAISDAVRGQGDRSGRRASVHNEFSGLDAEAPRNNPGLPAQDAAAEERVGKVIAVWGPAGAPGRTLLAVNLAAELAAAGSSVMLVDADSYGASAAAVLGLLDEAAGLAQACRLADQGVLTVDALRTMAADVHTKGGTLQLLSGITRADRWTELRPSALSTVLEVAAQTAQVVVIDVGFCLESDEELSFDTLAPRRNGATLRCLELADEVIAVGAADAIGVPRLVRGLAELETAVPNATVRVVMNKVRSSSAGRSPRRQLSEAWERFGPAHGIEAYLPADFEACDAALLSGQVLSECAPDSALRRAIAGLVCAPNHENRRSFGRSSRALTFLKR
ncbi:P-loop NTPase [Paenarthrobacter sp. S56]|uniref:AAA family ATPase n=1 Tax=Paenarthrobacter sp. S56 TaxID=3138179 RepID=UPI00321C0764